MGEFMRPPNKDSTSPLKGKRSSLSSFLIKLKERKIIETLATFLGGGWLVTEIVHWILVDHYHFPEQSLDITIVTLLGIMICTLTWRWFSAVGTARRIKVEFIVIPLVMLPTVYLDIRLIQHISQPELEIAPVEKRALPLPDKPSVAVLPSTNLSGDLEQAHGLTENKTKGKSVKVQQMDEETRKKEAAEIARLENELAEMDTKIAAMKEDLRTTSVSEQDGLPAMLAMVEKREKQHQRLDELRERQQQAIEHDIGAYEKIVSSPYGKDLKEKAWKKLVANYPEAADLAPGKVEVLKLLLLKKWVEPTTGMEFVWVEGGCFQMGDTWKEGDDDEKPVHEVCVDSFGMSRYEVTQGQWQKIMGYNPSGSREGDNYPVERVSWVDTQDFICKLNSHSGMPFRLPTEAEWEYAARSGGKKEKYAGGSDLDRLAWYEGNSGGSTHPVGTKEPNNLGLYDMSGNVWEWCSDWYGRNYYQQSPRNNPQGPSVGSFRVIRDGCWNGSSWLARSAHRDKFGPVYRLDNLGFRLVLPGK